MCGLFKLSMFITSFAPLWLTVIFIDVISIIHNNTSLYCEYFGIISILLFNAISVVVICCSMSTIESHEYLPYAIIEAIPEKGITSEFLLSYILPLFTFDFTQWISVVEFLIYFFVLAFLCIRNNNVYANLFFEIRKYKFYSCELQWKSEPSTKPIQCIVISMDNLAAEKGNVIEVAVLNKPFYLLKNH